MGSWSASILDPVRSIPKQVIVWKAYLSIELSIVQPVERLADGLHRIIISNDFYAVRPTLLVKALLFPFL